MRLGLVDTVDIRFSENLALSMVAASAHNFNNLANEAVDHLKAHKAELALKYLEREDIYRCVEGANLEKIGMFRRAWGGIVMSAYASA